CEARAKFGCCQGGGGGDEAVEDNRDAAAGSAEHEAGEPRNLEAADAREEVDTTLGSGREAAPGGVAGEGMFEGVAFAGKAGVVQTSAAADHGFRGCAGNESDNGAAGGGVGYAHIAAG